MAVALCAMRCQANGCLRLQAGRQPGRPDELASKGDGPAGAQRIGKTTGRSALLEEYWCGRCQVRCRSERGQFTVELMRFGVGSEASMARERGAGERCDRIRHLLHERPGRRRVELLERDLVGAHDVVGGRGDQQPERGQHAGPERNHDPTDAELRREVAGVQWPGPPEGDERRLPGIAALLRHVHAHRRPHRLVLVGDRHRPVADKARLRRRSPHVEQQHRRQPERANLPCWGSIDVVDDRFVVGPSAAISRSMRSLSSMPWTKSGAGRWACSTPTSPAPPGKPKCSQAVSLHRRPWRSA